VADLVRKTGDTSSIYGVLLDGTGAAVDIEGATIRFLMRRRGRRLSKVAAAASNLQVTDGSDGSRGNVAYTPDPEDVDEAGTFDYEWEATFGGGTVQSYPEGRYLAALFTEHLG
jgi:hypothetical protein